LLNYFCDTLDPIPAINFRTQKSRNDSPTASGSAGQKKKTALTPVPAVRITNGDCEPIAPRLTHDRHEKMREYRRSMFDTLNVWMQDRAQKHSRGWHRAVKGKISFRV